MKVSYNKINDLTEKTKLTPPLKWAGGKRWLIPRLLKIYSKYQNQRLVEPFVGGLSIALGLNPNQALLNDVNLHLINFYKQIQKGLKADLEMKNERAFFNTTRAKFNQLISNKKANSQEAAIIFYYLNRTCFNGLCRFNSKGEFNVPFGSYAKINYQNDFTVYMNIFKKWKFQNTDFELIDIRKNDFLYLDPPYDVEFTKYSKDDFKWEDQERLLKWLAKLKCPTVASNQATPRIVKLYTQAGFKINKIYAPRRISCNGNRNPTLEILATKNI